MFKYRRRRPEPGDGRRSGRRRPRGHDPGPRRLARRSARRSSQTNFRPSLDIDQAVRPEVAREQQHPAAPVLPRHRVPADLGPFNAQRPDDSRSRRRVFTCTAARSALVRRTATMRRVPRRRERGRMRDADPRWRAAPIAARRRRQDVATLMEFFREGRKDGTFDEGIELALRRLLASPQFLVRAEREPATVRAGTGLSHHRPGAGVAALVLPVEQHPG